MSSYNIPRRKHFPRIISILVMRRFAAHLVPVAVHRKKVVLLTRTIRTHGLIDGDHKTGENSTHVRMQLAKKFDLLLGCTGSLCSVDGFVEVEPQVPANCANSFSHGLDRCGMATSAVRKLAQPDPE